MARDLLRQCTLHIQSKLKIHRANAGMCLNRLGLLCFAGEICLEVGLFKRPVSSSLFLRLTEYEASGKKKKQKKEKKKQTPLVYPKRVPTGNPAVSIQVKDGYECFLSFPTPQTEIRLFQGFPCRTRTTKAIRPELTIWFHNFWVPFCNFLSFLGCSFAKVLLGCFPWLPSLKNTTPPSPTAHVFPGCKEVACGSYHALAVGFSGKLFAWGRRGPGGPTLRASERLGEVEGKARRVRGDATTAHKHGVNNFQYHLLALGLISCGK